MPAVRPIPCGHKAHAPSCVWCRLLVSDPRYAALYGRPAPAPAAPCVHLGAPAGRTVACPSCRGRVELKLFHCDVHGRCTLGRQAPGVACCAGCPDRAATRAALPPPPAASITTRDVLYHVMPKAGEAGTVWRQRLGMLTRRAGLFNGLKVVSCMTGPGLEPPERVRELAEPSGFEVVALANDPDLREVVTLLALLPRFETSDPSRALLFAHAKGITRPADAGNSCHPWALLCHEICLDYWPLVERQLSEKPITGPFKKTGHAFAGSPSSWHYSCGFWWVRSAGLFRRDWRGVERKWFGSESHVGVWYRPEEAGCLFHEAPAGVMDLYRPDYLQKVLWDYALWRIAHDRERAPAGVTA